MLISYYRDNWNGSFNGTDEELTQLLSRASDVINNIIALSGYTIETVPDVLEERVKKSICAQADYIDNNGGVNFMSECNMGAMSLGKFSYSGIGNDSGSASGIMCRQALDYLLPTGLLYRGVMSE